MIYCDASLLVATLVEEAHSDVVTRWLSSHSPAELVISDWTITEVGSALAFKLRLGHIGAEHHTRSVAAAAALFADLTVVSIEKRHFIAAGEHHVLAPPNGLRAGDALHLAIVADHALALATLDRRFAIAAEQSGVRVEDVLSIG